MNKLSESIIRYRKAHTLSQEAFGRLLNVTPEDILEHPNGKREEETGPCIQKENHPYDVGLNHLFANVIDFCSFSQFIDGYLAVQKVFSNKEAPVALLLFDLRFDDEV